MATKSGSHPHRINQFSLNNRGALGDEIADSARALRSENISVSTKEKDCL